MRTTTIRSVAAAVLCAAAASARAQDYTATNSSGLFEARPAGATQLTIRTGGAVAQNSTVVNLPFAFPYYGKLVTTATVCAAGFIVPGGTATIGGTPVVNTAPHGQDATSGAFPYTQGGTGGAGAQNVDGIVAPDWDTWDLGNGTTTTGYVYTWTSGAAPNRRFIVLWEQAWPQYGSGRITAELHLYEGSGRIVFAYGPGSSWVGTAYVCGFDSPIDARFEVPTGVANSATNATTRVDVVFDPRVVAVTGTLHYDKIVSDSSGVGNSVLGDRPLAGFSTRLVRPADGLVYATATSGSDGSFSLVAYGAPSSATGSVVVLAQNAACNVTTTGGATTSWTAADSVSLSADAPLGVVPLGLANDANGSLRSAFNVALTCGAARDWVATRSATTIPPLAVVFNDATTADTSYVPASGNTAAALYVGGRSSSNPDAWDDAVATKTYARHVIATIAAPQTTALEYRFDAVTDPQNAFAEGFGCWLWAAVSGGSQVIDGKSATSATVFDLEHPTISSPVGADVAGRVAGALFDLQDAANETIDAVDGTSAPDRVLQLVDAFAVAPTASTFEQAWIDAGYDAAGIARIYVGNGLLPDDASEPNDSAADASPLGAVGVVRRSLVLNRFNEDWFSVTLPAAADSLLADAAFDRVSLDTVVALEIRDAAGTLLATGTPAGTTGPVHAATSAVPAGTYKIGVRYASGVAVPTYSVQSYLALGMAAKPLVDWTVGRDYDAPLGVVGGIPPIAATTPSSSMPPGLGLNQSDLHAVGRPTTPGTYQVAVQVKDDGDPANVVQRTQTVVIHDVFKMPIAPFVGFPAGKAVDATLPTHEGTPPFTLTMSSGALTSGLSFAPNSLHVTGTPAAGPSSAFELDGVDVAGSADHVATRAVVAVQLAGKKIPADLAAGVDACGWWFDAVEGSTATFAVATAKGAAKRLLTGALLAPDRSLVATGKFVGKLGGVAASRLVCPQSGRYYFVASSTDSGAATQLLGTATVAPPRSGKGLDKTFHPSDTTTIEFGVLPNSTATVKFAGDKKATLVARVVAVYGPDGGQVSTAGLVKTTPTGGTLTLSLSVGGTWRIVLGATSTTNAPGKLTYSYALKQGKGVYSAD